jgi:hypothetical protein
LKACHAAADLDILSVEISLTEMRGRFKARRESTTTSPSGRHLGRYKALFVTISDHQQQDHQFASDTSLAITQQQMEIAKLILRVINFCLTTGHILERWKTIINTMIFKETGNYKIHRLRVIHIYEADFNMILAIKWRQLVHHSLQTQSLNQGLVGGRPGCEPQSLTFLEELKYDISLTSRRTLFNFDNDASSCYDRIIISLASLINRKYGLNRKVVAVHADTLRLARFFLRSQDGLSATSYSHCLQFPIHGSGQGSANSPCIWLFISSTLCDVHLNSAHGAFFTTPDESETVKFSMVGFVDDCTGTFNDFQPQTEAPRSVLTKRMETDAQLWNDLLWCSGGYPNAHITSSILTSNQMEPHKLFRT